MKDIESMTMQDWLKVMMNMDTPTTKNVFKSKYKPGETVYVAHFCNETVSNISATIRQSYKFRPKKGIIKEVIFDASEHPTKYKIIGMTSNCFSEELVSDSEEECKHICNILNQPRN